MTGQQLRNSILQEAIQGRLVPNVLDSGEKTGAELLRQILKERQDQENKEKGKKAKKLTLSNIEEEPWELPQGWCWCKLGDVISLQSGRDLEPDKYNASNKGIPYITGASNFDRGSIIINRWTPNPVSVSNRGDLLITCKGTVGELAFNTVGDVHIARQIMAISAIIVDANYIQIYLKAKVNDLNAQANGVIPGISREDILFADFPLPPLSIQKAIVAKIEELLPLVDEYDKAAGELETLNKILPDKLRKSVLQEAIHGNLVPNDIPEGEATGAELLRQILKERQDQENKEKGKKAKKLLLSEVDDDVEELPDGWCWCKLSDIGDCLYGVSESSKNAGSYKLLRITDIQNDAVNWDTVPFSDYKKKDVAKYFLNNGDLVFARTGGTVGKSYLIQNAPRNAIYASYLIRVRFQGKALLPKYIKYFFQSPQYWSQIIENSEGTGQPNCNGTKLANLNIPLPPLTIQQRIVEKIEEVFFVIDKLTASKDSE